MTTLFFLFIHLVTFDWMGELDYLVGSDMRSSSLSLTDLWYSGTRVLIIFVMPPSRSEKMLNDSKLFWSMFYLYKWKSKYNDRIKLFLHYSWRRRGGDDSLD